MLIKSKKMGSVLYALTRKDLKKFDINELMPGDVLVVLKSMEVNSDSDYFVHINADATTVTTRYNLCTLYDYQMPRYIRRLTEDINVRLGYLRRSKFHVGDIVRRTDIKKCQHLRVRNVIANENGDVSYDVGRKGSLPFQKLLQEELLVTAITAYDWPRPCA